MCRSGFIGVWPAQLPRLVLRRALNLAESSVCAALKSFIIFDQKTLCFHFVGLKNYVAGLCVYETNVINIHFEETTTPWLASETYHDDLKK